MTTGNSGKRRGEEALRILIRGTNWIGDAVLTLPALSSIRNSSPQAHLSILAKPWVADIYRLSRQVDEVLVYESSGRHRGAGGILRLAAELRAMKFDRAILFQNAIEAAIIARLAGIRSREGYNTDARGFLLTRSVKMTQELKKIHQSQYYLRLVQALGCGEPADGALLHLTEEDQQGAERLLAEQGVRAAQPIFGMAPGATYGPAKIWHVQRFGELAARLSEEYGAAIVLFGSAADCETTSAVQKHCPYPLIDLAGKTNLRRAVAAMSRCQLVISNDSGLMHVAGALNIPTIAIFGSTNPATTSPLGEKSTVLYRGVECSPCLKTHCPTDFRCMNAIAVSDVLEIARGMVCRG